MNYYVYILTIIVERSAYEVHLPAHLDYLRQLDAAGTLVLSGPFTDRRGGMVMIRAESEAAARAVAEADPLVAQGVDTYELRGWRLTGGDLQRLQLETA
ncbi:MAG TPA: YciI family protein [Herpetosiphonaceae bacterium]